MQRVTIGATLAFLLWAFTALAASAAEPSAVAVFQDRFTPPVRVEVRALSRATTPGIQAAWVWSDNAAPRRIHTALRAIADGLFVVDDELSEKIVPQARARVELFEPLTEREQQVAQLLVRGLTNKEIAVRLGVTQHTVKFHLNGILRKLGVSTRTEAVVQAARLGVVVL